MVHKPHEPRGPPIRHRKREQYKTLLTMTKTANIPTVLYTLRSLVVCCSAFSPEIEVDAASISQLLAGDKSKAKFILLSFKFWGRSLNRAQPPDPAGGFRPRHLLRTRSFVRRSQFHVPAQWAYATTRRQDTTGWPKKDHFVLSRN